MKLLKELNREAFKTKFGTKASCYEYLANQKWAKGYSCKKCKHTKYIKGKQPYSRRCCKCGYNESTTTGTLFHKLKFGIDKAFEILYEIAKSKKGGNSIWLAKHFGMQHKTTLLFLHKVQLAMGSSEQFLFEQDGNQLTTACQDLKFQTKPKIKEEEALFESEQKVKNAFMASPYSISINSLESGKFVFVNKGFENHTGYLSEEVIGKSSKEINIWKNYEKVLKVFKEPLVNKGSVKDLEIKLFKKDGSVITWLMNAEIFYLNDEPHIISTGYNITEKKKPNKLLLKNERKKAIEEISISESGIALYEYDNAIDKMTFGPSAYKVFGRLPDQMPETFEKYVQLLHEHEQDKENELTKWRETINSDTDHWANEYWIKKNNGDIIWIRDRAILIRDENNKLISLFGTVVDISKQKETEKELLIEKGRAEESEEKYRKLLDSFIDGIYISTPEYKISYLNEPMKRLIGGDKTGETCFRAIRNRNQKCDVCVFYKLKKGKPITFDLKDEIRNEYWTIRNILLEDGSIMSIYYDVTRQKRAELAIKESEKHFRTLIEKSPLPMMITDENQDVELLNERFTELFGYTISDISTVEKWWVLAYPDIEYRKKVQTSWMNAIDKAKKNTNIEMWVGTLTIKDGTRRTCELYMVPLGKKNLIEIKDITKRRTSQLDLRIAKERAEKSESEMRERVKELQGIYALGLLTEKHENISMVFSELVSIIIPNSMQFPKNTYVSLDVEGKKYSNKPNYFLPKGTYFLSAPIQVFKKPAGKLIVSYTKDLGFLDVFEQKLIDAYAKRVSKIAEQFKIKKELFYSREKAEQAKSELEQTLHELKFTQKRLINSEKMASIGILSAGVAHEINNPITYISSGMIGLKKCYDKIVKNLNDYRSMRNLGTREIQQFKLDNDKTINQTIKFSDDMFRSIREGIDRTVEIISSMRVLARSTEDVFSELSINDCLDTALITVYILYKNDIEIIKNYSKESIISGISGNLLQVFINVITNAIQAIPESGRITIATSWNKKGDRIIIKIKDTGKGFPDEIKGKVFDPFFSTKEVGKGTGLGLFISYNMIEQHNGSITFKSKEGEGTECTIELPKQH